MNELARVVFAITFLLLRCIFFPRVIVLSLWPDMWAAVRSNDVRPSWVVFGWIAISSVLLTVLQLFWGYKIIKVVAKGNLTGDGARGMKAVQEVD